MADDRIRQRAFQLPVAASSRFCLLREPAAGVPRGCVVHVPAFAEEMNKSRRMTAWCARELAARGYTVLQFDLAGCGDSAGDFADASWEGWISDVHAAVAAARDAAAGPLWLWGLRAGALLACAALAELPRDTSLLLWHPVVSGKQHLAQFLRLAVAADAIAVDADRAQTGRLRERLAEGEAVEIAGYRLSPAVAAGLDAATLALPRDFSGEVAWFEVMADGLQWPPPSSTTMERWRSAGARVHAQAVSGARFWQTVEIEDCPALVDATVATLADRHEQLDRAAAAV